MSLDFGIWQFIILQSTQSRVTHHGDGAIILSVIEKRERVNESAQVCVQFGEIKMITFRWLRSQTAF